MFYNSGAMETPPRRKWIPGLVALLAALGLALLYLARSKERHPGPYNLF